MQPDSRFNPNADSNRATEPAPVNLAAFSAAGDRDPISVMLLGEEFYDDRNAPGSRVSSPLWQPPARVRPDLRYARLHARLLRSVRWEALRDRLVYAVSFALLYGGGSGVMLWGLWTAARFVFHRGAH